MNKETPSAENPNSDPNFKADSLESDFLRVLNRVHATLARHEMRLAEKDRRKVAIMEWQQVSFRMCLNSLTSSNIWLLSENGTPTTFWYDPGTLSQGRPTFIGREPLIKVSKSSRAG